MVTASSAWLQNIELIRLHGDPVRARGRNTRELQHHTVVVDMRYPVTAVPARKLSYQFMAAEAFWILSGDDTVQGIAPWNKHISQFSDDGRTFFGAYGPRIKEQLPSVLAALTNDEETRQAVITTWRPSPPASKDVPCTVAFVFQIRRGFLDLSVFMRSSDAWLGVPYDIFNFSMLAHLVCGLLNEKLIGRSVTPGVLRLTAASAHLYEDDLHAAAVMSPQILSCAKTPPELYMIPEVLINRLRMLRESKPGDHLRWWECR